MNERIRELAEQAGFDLGNGQSYKVENFAELIVRECASIADKETSHPCKSYGQLIKQHFGVEE